MKSNDGIKGERREAKRQRERYGMKVSGASIRRIQLALIEQARKKAKKRKKLGRKG